MPYNNALWITIHSEGTKMEGFCSTGTSCSNNPYCKMYQKCKDNICHECYAETYTKMRKFLNEHLLENAEILTKRLLTPREIPYYRNEKYHRFESFGDLHNEIHLQNYILIAEANPETIFGLWTKNIWICDNIFNKMGIKKPDNLIINASSMRKNTPLVLPENCEWIFDHIFTVYTEDYINENNIEINCGNGRKCIRCLKCYRKGGVRYINEHIK